MSQFIRFLFLLFIIAALPGQAQNLTQTIRGRVIDKESQEPLIGASVSITTTNPVKGNITDTEGYFKIEGVPVGRHNLRINYIGYEEQVIPELLLGSGKELILTVGLLESIRQMNEVVITATSGQEKGAPLNEMATLSARSISVEETKRYAASINDPARAAQSYAGVGTTDDTSNEIVVRGNSPRGVLYRLEGIEIPNPTHFAEEGASGGAISILSVNMLDNSDFYTSAFPAEYGNALSGIFDIKLRRGNNEKREYALQAGILGVDFAMEGPFKKGYKGSYLVNYRYSTLAILNKVGVKIAGDAAPNFQDFSFKLYLPTTNAGVFSIWGISGYSEQVAKAERDASKWKTSNDRNDEIFAAKMGVVGVTHTYFLKNNDYLESAVSFSGSQNKFNLDSLGTDYKPNVLYNEQLSNVFARASVLYNRKFNSQHTLRTGIIASQIGFDLFAENQNDDHVLTRELDNSGSTGLYQAYAQWKYRLTEDLTLNTGLHAITLGLNGSTSIEPRAGIKYAFNPRQSIGGGIGLHSRHEAMSTYYAQKRLPNGELIYPNKELDFTKSMHYVLSYDHQLREDLRLKVETYYQRLFNVPIFTDPKNPEAALNAQGGFTSDSLINEGTGRNYGVEFTLEKFFTNNYYFLLTNSIYDSKYTGIDGVQRNTRFNANYIVNFLAGKEFKVGQDGRNLLSANIKLNLAGGNRYTPIDIARSVAEDRTVLKDNERYTAKADDYFRTDLRFSYRKNKPKASYILSLDIQNVSNRLNMYRTYFDAEENAVKTATMTGLIPVLNYRIEF